MIRTMQLRRHRSEADGEVMLICHVYKDALASLETWIEHATMLAAEFGISVIEAHNALFAQLPEIFGR